MSGRLDEGQVARSALAIAATAAVYAAYLVVAEAAGLPEQWAVALATALVLFASAAGSFVVRAWWYGPAAGACLAGGLAAVGAAVDLFGAGAIVWPAFLAYAANVANLCVVGGLLGWAARLTDDRLRETWR